MKLALIIYSNDSETVWNAFRLGLFAVQQGDSVSVFLLAKGVECESLDTERFQVQEQARRFLHAGGKILACGTCLKLRNNEGSDLCPVSTMKDLYELIRDADKVITL